MAPNKGKKKSDMESTTKSLLKKTPKSLKAKRKIAKESVLKNSAPAKQGETNSHEKTPNSLKAKQKIAKESVLKNPAASKEGETSSQVKDKMDNAREGMADGKKVSGQTKRAQKRPNTQSGNKNERHIAEKHKKLKNRDQHFTEKYDDKQVKDRKENVRKGIKDGQSRRGEKRRHTQSGSRYDQHIDEKHKDLKRRDQRSSEKLGGMIFMCSMKTKPDCFRYHVMGVNANKQDVVMRIRTGLKLFLYDFDLRLLYGIYEASSHGGMKLEPAAFGGGFPAQVRFTVTKDCLPLTENVFKKAIRDNYNEKTHKFKTELSVAQVDHLIKLFTPTPWLHGTSKSSLPESVPESVIHRTSGDEFQQQVYREPYIISKGAELLPIGHERSILPNHHNMRNDVPSSPLYLTEKEYRSHGLRPGRTNSATYIDSRLNHYGPDEGRDQSLRNPNLVSGTASLPDPYYLGEKEYRNYGHNGYQEHTNTFIQPSVETDSTMISTMNLHGSSYRCDPYNDSTKSLVNRYLSLPRTPVEPLESYSLTGIESYISNPNYIRETEGHGGHGHPGREIAERESRYSPYDPHVLSDLSRRYEYIGNDTEYKSTPVLYRSSFTGPSSRY